MIGWCRRQIFRRFISIRVKLVVALTAVILLFVGIALYSAYSFVVALSKQELNARAELWVNLAKSRLSHMAMMNDRTSIDKFINQMQQDNPEILYIVVRDKHRAVIASTMKDDSLPALPVSFLKGLTAKLLRNEQRRLSVREISPPLMSGAMGYVTIGFNESVAAHWGRMLLAMMALAFALFLIPTLVVAFLLSHFITRPIRQIMKILEKFTPGQTFPKINMLFNDEFQLLGLKFHEMTNRLNSMISEFKQTQLHMIETEKLASIGTLASGVAHEINNPIAGIEICVHRLQKSLALDPKQEEYIRLITDATKHIQVVVRSLLTYARKPDQKIELVDLCSVMNFSLKLLHYRLQKKAITVKRQLPDSPCEVWGIRAQLVQVMVNAIINAIDASNSEGTISIQISPRDKWFDITISDNGVGLDASIAGKVFDPFFSTKGSQGTGLGLYVSYNIIAAHNGIITLSPNEQGGARLEIHLRKAGEEQTEMKHALYENSCC